MKVCLSEVWRRGLTPSSAQRRLPATCSSIPRGGGGGGDARSSPCASATVGASARVRTFCVRTTATSRRATGDAAGIPTMHL